MVRQVPLFDRETPVQATGTAFRADYTHPER